MTDPFETAKRKIDRAQKHFLDLGNGINALGELHAYKQIVEPDPNRPEYRVRKIKLVADISEPMNAIADTAAQFAIALRSSLDNAGFAIATSLGKPNSKHCSFPFAKTLADMPGSLGMSKDLPPEIQSLFCGFQPYKGGNDTLWAVNEICNADKHRITKPVITAFTRKMASAKGTGYFEIPTKHQWDSTKNEMILITTGPGAEFDYQFDFGIHVAFDEIEPIKGHPIVSVLHNMGCVVYSILMAIEAECRRLKLF